MEKYMEKYMEKIYTCMKIYRIYKYMEIPRQMHRVKKCLSLQNFQMALEFSSLTSHVTKTGGVRWI